MTFPVKCEPTDAVSYNVILRVPIGNPKRRIRFVRTSVTRRFVVPRRSSATRHYCRIAYWWSAGTARFPREPTKRDDGPPRDCHFAGYDPAKIVTISGQRRFPFCRAYADGRAQRSAAPRRSRQTDLLESRTAITVKISETVLIVSHQSRWRVTCTVCTSLRLTYRLTVLFGT